MFIPFLDSALDLATVSFVSALIILSALSLCFIFHLRLKSQSLTHLQEFNSLWTVRFLLVLFIFLWAITELLRLPFFRHRYLYPFLPSVPIPQQANLCKVHLVLSLGLFQPAFLVTLLFLLNASIRKKTPKDHWPISFLLFTTLPIALLQSSVIILKPLELHLPLYFHRAWLVRRTDDSGIDTVLCAYPLLNTIVFATFGACYAVWFIYSSWRVLSLVINKGLRLRIYGLAAAVLGSLALQIVFLGLAAMLNPEEECYAVVSLVVFVGAFFSAAAGEGILVIKPISDALDAGGNCCPLPRNGGVRRRTSVVVAEAQVKAKEEVEGSSV